MTTALDQVESRLRSAQERRAELQQREGALTSAVVSARADLATALAAGEAVPPMDPRRARIRALESERDGLPQAIEQLDAEIAQLWLEAEASRERASDEHRAELLANGRASAAALQAALMEYLQCTFLPAYQKFHTLAERLYKAEVAAGRTDLSATSVVGRLWDEAPGLQGTLLHLLADLAEDGPRKRTEQRREQDRQVAQMYERAAQRERESEEENRKAREAAAEAEKRSEAEATEARLQAHLARDRAGIREESYR